MGAPPAPDLILLKGVVLTMGKKQPQAQALATKGDRIVAVGSNEDVKALAGSKTKVVDLRGKVVVPGFVDAHTHLTRRGLDLTRLDLGGAKSLKSLLEAVRKQVKLAAPGAWIIGHGWDESKWPEAQGPGRDDLDRVAPNNPVLLRRVDGHLCVVNTMAMGNLSVPLNAPGVEVDDTGKRTGVLTENAAEDAYATLPFHMDEALAGLAEAVQEAFKHGVTSVHQTSEALDIRVLRTAQHRKMAAPRVYLKVLPALLEPAASLGLVAGLGDERVRYGAVKVFTDGSLGARTAALTGEYADKPGTRGLLLEEPQALAALVEKAHSAGFQLALHCIGDRAVGACLDALEQAVKKHPRKDHRHRLEHFEGATDEQVARAQKLGAVASVQPNFIGNWGLPGQMYEARLGKDGARTLNRFRVMADMGLRMAFGSDHMPLGPLNGLHWAVNAPHKEQRLEPEEALRAYTLDAAYASFEEHAKGSIEVGKLADLVVLNGNPLAKPKDIAKMRVEMTLLGGEVVYKRP
jgi:predicted amidohydrolase YtcJ